MSTGLRLGEILALQWSDLDFKTGELRITKQVSRIQGKLVVSEPKTKAAIRTIILPPATVEMLRAHKDAVNSRWLFPSPKKEDAPLDPASVRKKLCRILERAGCRKIRFHDLRHTFATMALEYGMDVKTLSTVIGHISAATTLNIYTHTTDDMRKMAAIKIDQGIGKQEPTAMPETKRAESSVTEFVAYTGKRRKPGTGCISQIGERLWEGKYSPRGPDGKKRSKNVYAHSREACEEKLAEMILQVKAEIAAERERLKTQKRAG